VCAVSDVTWAVGLTGGEWELGELSHRFGTTLQILRGVDGWELRCDTFCVATKASMVRELARDVVLLINGIARLHLDNPDPIAVGNISHYREGGGRDVFVFLDEARVRLRAGTPVVLVNGVAAPIPSWEPDVLLAAADERALAVLSFLSGDPTWHSLYGAYETIEKDRRTDGKRGIKRWAGVSSNQLDRLTATANAFPVLGVEARHGVIGLRPPADPMGRPDAEALVRHIALAWFAELRQLAVG